MSSRKIKTVVCGCGHRGKGCATLMIALDKFDITAVCDPYEDKAQEVAQCLKEKSGHEVAVYTDHITMFEIEKPEATLVVTTWETHVGVAVDALRHNIAVMMEVGGAYNLEECNELVRAYEETKTPFMFMENCCYGKDELLVTSLVRNNLLGEVVFCGGAYRHDIREEIASGKDKRHYRLRNYLNRNCENYPTHELGPIAKILNINRGNRMVSLVSFASKSCGLHEYIKDKPQYEFLQETQFKQGDIVQTLITCENGELISLRLDTTLPHFYGRELNIRGTKGAYNQDGNFVLIDGELVHEPVSVKSLKKIMNNAEKYERYLPSIWRPDRKESVDLGHGEMDSFVFEAFAEAYLSGTEMPIDVYDAVAWMSITCLSEISIKENRIVTIPDFTNGAYKTRPSKDVVNIPIIN